ncbi:MAG TPA: DegT/DnrJ/EryC1/StrS family aminotransferase, partial [Luteimonas sp.]|nr:DegT/DnrJ/EryC1/StrS family aminotransferase [Luteimonas sp.]
CEMDTLLDIARRHGLAVIEDAAQGMLSRYRGRHLGSFGEYGALSFHETKNVISGEGGALLVREPGNLERAEIVREKGTNRSQFFRGQVDKYTWVGPGSSYLPGEITAAFLAAQLDEATALTARRLAIWDAYHAWAEPHERAGRLRRPTVPEACTHNAHMYYLVLPSLGARTSVIESLRRDGVNAVFHYVPLHSSPAGRRLARTHGELAVTDAVADGLMRMPLWIGLDTHLPEVFAAADRALQALD